VTLKKKFKYNFFFGEFFLKISLNREKSVPRSGASRFEIEWKMSKL
jgi:hypothetical protein